MIERGGRKKEYFKGNCHNSHSCCWLATQMAMVIIAIIIIIIIIIIIALTTSHTSSSNSSYISIFRKAYAAHMQRMEDDAWLIQQCADPQFASRMLRQHNDICSQVSSYHPKKNMGEKSSAGILTGLQAVISEMLKKIKGEKKDSSSKSGNKSNLFFIITELSSPSSSSSSFVLFLSILGIVMMLSVIILIIAIIRYVLPSKDNNNTDNMLIKCSPDLPVHWQYQKPQQQQSMLLQRRHSLLPSDEIYFF